MAICNGQVIGSVRLETSGPRRGEWVWSMWRDAADIDMRWDREGLEATEEDAKARVVEAYEELLRRAAQGALDHQHGRIK